MTEEITYETKEEAIERAKMIRAWSVDPDARIMVHRNWLPLWFAHLVRGTWFQWIAYTEIE